LDTQVKNHRIVAVSTALALFATLATAGAAVAAPTAGHSRQLASAVIAQTTPLTVTEFSTTGYSATVDGFQPGATVRLTFAGAPVGDLTADPTGTVVFSYVNTDPAIGPGSYTFVLGQTSWSRQTLSLTVTADAVTPPTPAVTPPTPTPPTAAACVTSPLTGSAPTSIPVSGIRGTGYTASAGGFTPGETVDVVLATGQSAGGIGEVVADGACAVVFTYVDGAALPAGDGYVLTLEGATESISFPFSITADAVVVPAAPAAVAAPTRVTRAGVAELAETGFDPSLGMLAAAGLLAAGAAAFALRRQTGSARG
jgi:hypothetical protein